MLLVMTAFDALFAATRIALLLDVGPWRWDWTRPIWAHFQFNYLGNLAAYLTFPKRLVAYFWHDFLEFRPFILTFPSSLRTCRIRSLETSNFLEISMFGAAQSILP